MLEKYINNDNFEITALRLLDGILDIIEYWPKDHIMMVFGSTIGMQLYEVMSKRKLVDRIPPSGVIQT